MLEDNLAQIPAGTIPRAAKRRLPALETEVQSFLGALRRETDNRRTF